MGEKLQHMMDDWEQNPVLSLNRALRTIQCVPIGPPTKHSFVEHQNFAKNDKHTVHTIHVIRPFNSIFQRILIWRIMLHSVFMNYQKFRFALRALNSEH